MPRSILILFCLGAVLLAAGCGGGGGSQMSEAAFKTRANEICKQLTSQEKPDVSASTKAGIDRNLARIDSALAQLEKLHPPTKDEQRFQTLLKNFRQSDEFAKANEVRLIQMTRRMRLNPSDSRTAGQYQQLVRPFVQQIQVAASAASDLGLPACADGLSGGSSSSGQGSVQPSP